MTERLSPRECHQLVAEQGYVYLDVRSVQEFAQGHPQGAYNIPLLFATPFGMQPNPEFVATVKASFPPGSRLVLG